MGAGDLERAFTLTPAGDDTWTTVADPNYEAANGMFGGWTAAMAVEAVWSAADRQGEPASATINFVTQIPPGSDPPGTTCS